MAEVFLAVRQGPAGFERAVAVKRVQQRFSHDPAYAAMFQEEARLAAALSHPNVVSVLDCGRDANGRLLLAMEYVEGPSLSELLEGGPLPPSVAIFVMTELLSALAYLHAPPGESARTPLVHRDVSPHNVLLSRDGMVKLSDFGVAKALEKGLASASNFAKGKTSYAAPEHLNGQPLDPRADLFAAGAVLWELLVGRRLFRGSIPGEIVAQVLFREIPKPSSARPDVPPDLEDVVMRLLARDPAERYATAGEASRALSECRDAAPEGGLLLAALVSEHLARSGTCRSPKGKEGAQPVDGGTKTGPGSTSLGSRAKARAPWELGFERYLELLDVLERSDSPCRSRDLALLELVFHAGLDVFEATALDARQLKLGERKFVAVKSWGEPKRAVPFNDRVSAALERYATDRAALPCAGRATALFVTEGGGRRLSVGAAHRIMRRKR